MLKTYLDDIRVALSLLTRLPIRVPTDAYQRSHKAVWAYGAAGAVWAICVWAVATLAMTFGLSPLIAAGLGLTMGVVVTGAMHEDGLADCADGFWGGWEPERRLDIMRDSRLGVYGSLALILSTLLRWNLIATILADANSLLALMLAGMFARAALPVIMSRLPHARSDGLSHSVGSPSGRSVYVSFGFAALIGLVFMGASGLMIAVIAAFAGGLCARLAQKKIGGQTGDVLGASAVITEISVMIAFILF